jgi:hypothetical protein
MKTIKLEITEEKILEAVRISFEEALKSTYRNPVQEAVDAELKEIGGSIRDMVKEMITNAISDEAFKEQMQKTVIEKLVMKAMSN